MRTVATRWNEETSIRRPQPHAENRGAECRRGRDGHIGPWSQARAGGAKVAWFVDPIAGIIRPFTFTLEECLMKCHSLRAGRLVLTMLGLTSFSAVRGSGAQEAD